MALEQILGFNLNGESVASLLNIKSLTLSEAATSAEQAIRLQEFNAGVDGLQAQLDAIDASHHSISEVHVDSASTTLQAALDLGTYDGGTKAWTFGDGTVIGSGDAIILQAATDPADRSWIHVGTALGNASDFERLSSDIQALINAGIASVTDALRDGVVEAGDTLAKLYALALSIQTLANANEVRLDDVDSALTTLGAEVDGKADVFQDTATFSVSGTAGIYEAVISNPTSNANAIVSLKSDVGGGVMTTVSPTAYADLVSEATITLRTMSTSMNGQSYTVVIEG